MFFFFQGYTYTLHFLRSNKLYKVFNRNIVKVSYCCTKNVSSIVKAHNKNVTNEKITPKDQCYCKNKNDYTLDGNCQTNYIIYKYIASSTIQNISRNSWRKFQKKILYSQEIIQKHKKGEWHHLLEICVGSTGQI